MWLLITLMIIFLRYVISQSHFFVKNEKKNRNLEV